MLKSCYYNIALDIRRCQIAMNKLSGRAKKSVSPDRTFLRPNAASAFGAEETPSSAKLLKTSKIETTTSVDQFRT